MTDHHTGPVPVRFCLLTDRHRIALRDPAGV